MTDDPQWHYDMLCELDGVETVRERLVEGDYPRRELPYLKAWLRKKDQEAIEQRRVDERLRMQYAERLSRNALLTSLVAAAAAIFSALAALVMARMIIR
ncbi:hypothetical protein [Novosphingobium mangrovi (ex Hu et al. 2023)]|uniref:DUF4880 domain-containing protein n=1 Tax=Novosphingobium mangrovi (ex Hu et al. 2023) TaxID=2930094 RepID=A0ABT0A8W5_9SPHN|nr:hypothetical protein [Novosphingobium mangrovi (ex Hu et al. 2023)]MCJ1959648.1 hypothetical protein [Novosphingobium mangrovi (ex Hu et al. 2023)]